MERERKSEREGRKKGDEITKKYNRGKRKFIYIIHTRTYIRVRYLCVLNVLYMIQLIVEKDKIQTVPPSEKKMILFVGTWCSWRRFGYR